jgi:CRP-like cAMP-binding protein
MKVSRTRTTIPPHETHTKTSRFNAQTFLDSTGMAKTIVECRRLQRIYSQGEAALTVIYIQRGGVKLSVVNELGKEAIVALLGPGDFFGEGCLAGVPFRMGIATAIVPTTVLVIKKKEMIRILHEEHKMLAEMIGTTRARVNVFMNKFRKLGFIRYNGGIHIDNSLLSVALHE